MQALAFVIFASNTAAVGLGTAGRARIGAHHTRFEGIDKEFEVGHAGGDDAKAYDGLAAEHRDPQVVDEIC